MVAAFLGLFAAPSLASAAGPQTFTVTATADSLGGPCEPASCTLRQAIEAANQTETADTIDFDVSGTIAPEFSQLPAISSPVTIDGTSAPGHGSSPIVEIDGVTAGSGNTNGLLFRPGASGSTVEALAIGDFEVGAYIEASEVKVCGSYLGVGTDGSSALPNHVGVEVWSGSENQIGAGCAGLGGGDVISGNSEYGIVDRATATRVAADSIGIDAHGTPLGNGEEGVGAGIIEAIEGSAAEIGTVSGRPANVITDSSGAGIILSRPLNKAEIRGNSIYGNGGLGIEMQAGGEIPPATPTIESVSVADGETTITGTASGGAGEPVALDFFANGACDPTGRGEGRTFLQSASVTGTGAAAPYSVTLPTAVGPAEPFITATATGLTEHLTSAFSQCARYALPQTYVVTTNADTTSGDTNCEGVEECSLRDAIRLADESSSADTIDFAESAEGTIELTSQLPAITQPVTIDATSAPGYGDSPVVAIDGGRELETGLSVQGPGEVAIAGLGIGGFYRGIYLGGAGHSQVCASWVGVGIEEISLQNSIGIYVSSGSQGNEIGADCGTHAAANVIGDNTAWGIEDYGSGTEIGNTRIGISPSGGPVPNAVGGIVIAEASRNAVIGSSGGGESANVIAYNGEPGTNSGPGIQIRRAATAKAAIRGNSIFGNAGLGIEVQSGEGETSPVAPTIETVTQVGADEITITGTASGMEGEKVALDFFANAGCNESGAGDGEAFLGSAEVSGTGAPAAYSATVPTAGPTKTVITATATGVTEHTTSDFSQCASFVPLPRTLTVNTLEDTIDPGECTATCSLRDAIETANVTAAEDTIDFGAPGTITVEGSNLPEITEPVEIDGTSAPGYAGTPLVLLDGSGLERGGEGGATEGLMVYLGGQGTVIKAIAIGGFEYGVWFHAEGGSQLCGSYIGVKPDGTTALPNMVGVEDSGGEGGTSDNELGAGCGSLGGNLISGNEEFGVLDNGTDTLIGGNRIGVDANGSPLPNGGAPGGGSGGGGEAFPESEGPGVGAGIVIAPEASGTTIGGIGDTTVPPNEIAYNDGPGILVASGGSRVAIRGNSIFSNEGKGIEISEEEPSLPTIEAASGPAGSLTIKGQAAGAQLEGVELDFFASAICLPGVSGEGERLLGSGSVLAEPGGTSYEATLAASTTDDQPFITVTATGTESGETSEFSECLRYVPPEPEHHEEPKHEEEKQPSTTNPPPTTEEPVPTNGEAVIVVPKEGKVLIKLPGTEEFVSLEELKEIPVGAVIDATKGKVTLTSIGPDGTEQTAVFFGGIFRVKQKEGSNVVVLEIIVNKICRGGMVRSGGASASAVATASAAGGKKGGKLWGSGHGSFKTEGNQGSATVRGTIWLVEDRCDGTTFFRTKRGVVTVKDFFLHKTLSLPAGNSYVAGEPEK